MAQALTDGLQLGAIALNNVAVSTPEAPFGGVKDSGAGIESGLESMESFLDTRTAQACT